MHPEKETREYIDGLLTMVAARVNEMTGKEARLWAIELIEQYPRSDYPKQTLRKLKQLIHQGRPIWSMWHIKRSELGSRLLIADPHESAYMVFHQLIVFVKATEYVESYLSKTIN